MKSKADHQQQPPVAAREDGAGFSRRGFLKSWGLGTVAIATGPAIAGAATDEDSPALSAEEKVPVDLSVNGRPHRVLAEPRWSLLYVLREELGLTAAKIGCERGECGACTVLMDDLPRYACMTLAVEATGQAIETAEGLMDGESPGSVQRSFAEKDALQCGYCTPGQVMAAEGLLRGSPAPSAAEIRHGMSGNLCRCGAYAHIFTAVADAAARRKG